MLSSPALAADTNAAQKLLLATLAASPRPRGEQRPEAGMDLARCGGGGRHVADPLVHERITPRLARFILDGGELVRHLAPLWRVPTLLLWAGADRCVAPRGGAAFARGGAAGHRAGAGVPGAVPRIFNEPERAQVLEHLLAGLRALA